MKRFRLVILYVTIILSILALIWYICTTTTVSAHYGVAADGVLDQSTSIQNLANIDWDVYFHDPSRPFILVMLQLIIIVSLSFVFGKLAGFIGMLPVIGEIIAGIFLGPSVMGSMAPSFNAFVFPDYSLTSLYVISQIGLAFFMFIIGMELEVDQFRKHSFKAMTISHCTIAFSSLLAIVLSVYIYADYAPEGVSFTAFALFMSVAMSITAFPVLARMLTENNTINTPVGRLLMTCAAIDDATAWCLLAIAVGIGSAASINGALLTIICAIGYVLLMFMVVRPFINTLVSKYFNSDRNKTISVLLAFLLLLVSSFITRFIGIHTLFGAFVAGVIISSNHTFKAFLIDKLKDVSLILFLPVFFTLSGLRTHIELLDSHLLGLGLTVIGVAVTGKILGGTIFSRMTGQSWSDSLYIGTMLNTRGLMELIVLNIGYDLNIISRDVYTVMVMMAVVTTLLTAPLVNLQKIWR